MSKNKKNKPWSLFEDSAILNSATFQDYLLRLRKIALSIFEWVNLPDSMNSMFLEQSLFEKGIAAFLLDKNLGIINTNCAAAGNLNIYGLPTSLNCYSFSYHQNRKLYTGLNENTDKQAILVMNNYDRTPTAPSLELFAYRLYQAQRTCDVNISIQKFPLLFVGTPEQRLYLTNLMNNYNGNQPFMIR